MIIFHEQHAVFVDKKNHPEEGGLFAAILNFQMASLL
jgi:hypothetical protein